MCVCEASSTAFPLSASTSSLRLCCEASLLSCPAVGRQNSRILGSWLAGLVSVVLGSQVFSLGLYSLLLWSWGLLTWTEPHHWYPGAFQLVDGPWWEFLSLPNCMTQLAYWVPLLPQIQLSFSLESIGWCMQLLYLKNKLNMGDILVQGFNQDGYLSKWEEEKKMMRNNLWNRLNSRLRQVNFIILLFSEMGHTVGIWNSSIYLRVNIKCILVVGQVKYFFSFY